MYQGTWMELREVNAEISAIQDRMDDLKVELAVVQQHRQHIIERFVQNARDGRTHAPDPETNAPQPA